MTIKQKAILEYLTDKVGLKSAGKMTADDQRRVATIHLQAWDFEFGGSIMAKNKAKELGLSI